MRLAAPAAPRSATPRPGRQRDAGRGAGQMGRHHDGKRPPAFERDGRAPSMLGVQLEADEDQQQTTDAARHALASRVHPAVIREQQAQAKRHRCGVQRAG